MASTEISLQELGKMANENNPEAAGPLIDLLKNETDRAMMERIMLALGQVLPLADYETVARAIGSSNAFIRNGAVEILKKSGKGLHPYIQKLATDPDKDIRKMAIDSLAKDDSPEAMKIIRGRLIDKDINIVITAVELLGNMGFPESSAEIENLLLEGANAMLLSASLEALAKIGNSPQSEKIIGKFSKEENPMLHFSFLRYMGRFGGENSFPYIEKTLNDHTGMLAKEIIDAVSGIVTNNNLSSLPKGLRMKFRDMMEGESSAKYDIIKLLAMTDRENSLELAIEMVKADDEMGSLSAIEILGDIGGETEIEMLEELAESAEDDELLEAIGDAVERIRERIQ